MVVVLHVFIAKAAVSNSTTERGMAQASVAGCQSCDAMEFDRRGRNGLIHAFELAHPRNTESNFSEYVKIIDETS